MPKTFSELTDCELTEFVANELQLPAEKSENGQCFTIPETRLHMSRSRRIWCPCERLDDVRIVEDRLKALNQHLDYAYALENIVGDDSLPSRNMWALLHASARNRMEAAAEYLSR